nr:retrotransposon protein, putative, Ty1-copia subclass [Tanacetum cinerariifolium]
MNEDYYHEQNSCYDSDSFGFDQFQPQQYTVNHPIFNNCPKCGHPVDGHYCQGCSLLRKKFKKDLFTSCIENGILQDSFEPSIDNTNVANALRDPSVGNQDPRKNSSQSPPQINHHCCYGCGDPLEDYCCSDGILEDKIICDLDKTPDLSQQSSQNYPKCGHPPSNENTNVANALREPFVVNQDPSKNSSQSPPQITHNYCYGCGDPLEDIFFHQCTCELCGNGAHYCYNCSPKVLIVLNPEPFNNQTIKELPPTVPSFDPTCYTEERNSFTYDSKSNLVHDSLNVFDPPPQPPLYSCEFYRNDTRYDHYCTPQVPFIYPKQCYNQDFDFPHDFHDFQQQYLFCENYRVTHKADQYQVANARYWKILACYDDADDDYTFAITPKEPDNSLSMGDEHLDTIPKTKSDKFIKSSVKNLVPNPNDYESKRDILILEELLSNDSFSLPENESFHFDIPLFSRPPAKPPDGNTKILNVKMMGDISEQKVKDNKDKDKIKEKSDKIKSKREAWKSPKSSPIKSKPSQSQESIKNNLVYFRAVPRNGIYEIDLYNSNTNDSFMYTVSIKRAKLNLDSTLLWHCRLGHISKKRIEKLQHDGLLNSTNIQSFEKCVSCMSGKIAQKPYSHQVERAKDLLGLIHTDVCGLFRTVSRQGARYFVTFTDDFSRYGNVYLLKHKYKVFETFKVFQKEVENQLGKTIKSLRSYRGGEYMCQDLLDHLKEYGIISHRTPLYTPQHSGDMNSKRGIIPMQDKLKLYNSQGASTPAEVKRMRNVPYTSAMGSIIKWFFKKKTGMDGAIHSYKARLVAKGFNQTYGVDYDETFSLLLDIRAIRILITIAAFYDYVIWKMDVKTAFLNGHLSEEVYMNSKRGIIPMQDKLKLYNSQGASTPAEVKRMRNVPYTSAMGSIIYLTDIDDCKSQTGHVFILNGGDVDWKSTKQSIFTTSSVEAEYIATYNTLKEVVWIRKFISGLGVVPTIKEPIRMYYDNTRA